MASTNRPNRTVNSDTPSGVTKPIIVVDTQGKTLKLIWIPTPDWAEHPTHIPQVIQQNDLRYIGSGNFIFGPQQKIVGPRNFIVFNGATVYDVNPFHDPEVEYYHEIVDGRIVAEPLLTTLKAGSWRDAAGAHRIQTAPQS